MTGHPQAPSSYPNSDCYIGLDLGTSGVRAIAIDRWRKVLAEATTGLPKPITGHGGISEQSPAIWWQGVVQVLRALTAKLPAHRVVALAVDGTSSTLLLCDLEGTPLTPALMYNDTQSRRALSTLAKIAPRQSPVHSASSSLAKLLHLQPQVQGEYLALHQADWILGKLSGQFAISDMNNCLKLGYDPENNCWPDWFSKLGLPAGCLPQVYPPGTVVGQLTAQVAEQTGLPITSQLVTGTTDSNAATLATGATEVGDAVTSLGSTLVLKILSEKPVFAPEYGIYSHRLKHHWLVGGASNSGGAVCAAHFSREEMARLTSQLQPMQPTRLDYYPLLQPGERFPINDPDCPPRLEPRPANDLLFFQGILEGIARIEVSGYELLQRLGAPRPKRVISIGGGAINEPWRQIREAMLGVPVIRAEQSQAAYGTALLALDALQP